MVELFTRGGSTRASRRNSGPSSRRSFLSFGNRRPDLKDLERFFPTPGDDLQNPHDIHTNNNINNNNNQSNLHIPQVLEIDTMTHHTATSFKQGGWQQREVQREIVASRSSRLLMRQVSALGLEDPAHGESGRTKSHAVPRNHPSHIFDDMDINDLPPDMREEESIASDPTAVVIVDRSLLMDMPDDSSFTKQSSVGGRPSDSSTKSHSKLSTNGGSTTPSTAPSRASAYFPSRSSCHRLQSPHQTHRTISTGRSTATGLRSSGRSSNHSLIAEAAQAMMVQGASCADPIVQEAMGQVERESNHSPLYHHMNVDSSLTRRRQSFCSYVPQRHNPGSSAAEQDDDNCSRSRAMPDFDNIFPQQQQQHPPQPPHYLQSPAGRSVKSSVSRRSVGNGYELGDDYSAAHSGVNSAARSMSSTPWRAPAPWNDEVAPSIFFKKGASPLSSPRQQQPQQDHQQEEEEEEETPSLQRAVSMEQTEDEEDDDLEPEELEQFRNELAELEAALSFR